MPFARNVRLNVHSDCSADLTPSSNTMPCVTHVSLAPYPAEPVHASQVQFTVCPADTAIVPGVNTLFPTVTALPADADGRLWVGGLWGAVDTVDEPLPDVLPPQLDVAMEKDAMRAASPTNVLMVYILDSMMKV